MEVKRAAGRPDADSLVCIRVTVGATATPCLPAKARLHRFSLASVNSLQNLARKTCHCSKTFLIFLSTNTQGNAADF
jgi:hypothetical protein